MTSVEERPVYSGPTLVDVPLNLDKTVTQARRPKFILPGQEPEMTRHLSYAGLLTLAFVTAVLGQSVNAQQESGESLPGITVETLGRGSAGGMGDALMLLRLTVEPGASIPASDGPVAAVVVLEEGRVGVRLESGEANLTLAGDKGTAPLTLGAETILTPGDSVSSGEGTRLALRNAGDSEATLLFAAVVGTDDSLLATSSQDASGMFSVETFACPGEMTLVTLDTEACESSAEPLVEWSLSLASDEFDASLDVEEATVSGATTTWQGLPSGTYYVELTAESFAPGYGDYFIPSSNQVTRQDERTTRIYVDATRSRESINAYVFAGEPATP
jgi:hypothetical protein